MILSYAALCREDEDYCRFYKQNDAAVLMQNGAALVVCANENADYDEIKQLAAKYTPEQFGLITYIAFQYSKWYPSDDPIWIVEY